MKLYFANPVQRGDGGGRSRAKRAAWAKPAVMCDVPVTVRKLPQVGLGHRHLDGAAAFEPETAHRLHRSEHRKAAEGPSIHAVAPRRHVPILGAETRGRLGRLAAGRGRFAMIVIELLFGLMLAGMVLLVLPFLLLMAGISRPSRGRVAASRAGDRLDAVRAARAPSPDLIVGSARGTQPRLNCCLTSFAN